MDITNLHTGKEGSETAVFLKETYNGKTQRHPDWKHHTLVWDVHGPGQEDSIADQ